MTEFKKGDKVYDTKYGDGEVVRVVSDDLYKVGVQFSNKENTYIFYTSRGYFDIMDKEQSLFLKNN
jgi:hypothetical protein